MASSVEIYLEETRKILEEHQKEVNLEVDGLIADLAPYITDNQKKHLEDALADFISATDNIMDEIDEAELAPSNSPGSGHHSIHNCWDR